MVENSNKFIIEIKEVTKSFKNQTVLQDINLNFEKGKIYGIRGRNGSGKTMLLRVMCGLVIPDSGEVYVNDINITKKKTLPENIGVLIENPGFINYYSGFKNLKILSSIKNKINDKKIHDTLEVLGIDNVCNKKVRTYSLGMRQRLGIAQALMEDPEILLLDEPTNALDNDGIKLLHDILKELKSKGTTIILSSHNKEDLDLLCDTVMEMDCGRLVIK
ncbi:ABC transporter ATP-binding protein [Clostridium sporogenes]|uniref:ABC transporter ATP-binding protein n=1 Tax=Clostridium botulinum TaxID=1491 RepID=UPI0007176377|nr:ATP-binding cassette domain-containing protein [Clostridium botulinum]KRU24311.1 ABC transporter ATP-binding protein [Clostridium sporogenes]KRU26098.1 ABC transporter ATP-binding protein [Clostridium sporogenes]KRU27154.1 ABC transporter ATP-binding protein [Clostridium sporogenes]KRU49014.1 ABC transporter ATP-binding protein [Clostridium sporogenes]MBZ1328687.1 ATP-binding cassette domain-containing protein [Clostridium botulinum]